MLSFGTNLRAAWIKKREVKFSSNTYSAIAL